MCTSRKRGFADGCAEVNALDELLALDSVSLPYPTVASTPSSSGDCLLTDGSHIKEGRHCIVGYAMQWNLLCQTGRRVRHWRITWRRTV